MDKLTVTYSYNGTLLSNKQGTHYWYVQQLILSFKLQKLYWVAADEYEETYILYNFFEMKLKNS